MSAVGQEERLTVVCRPFLPKLQRSPLRAVVLKVRTAFLQHLRRSELFGVATSKLLQLSLFCPRAYNCWAQIVIPYDSWCGFGSHASSSLLSSLPYHSSSSSSSSSYVLNILRPRLCRSPSNPTYLFCRLSSVLCRHVNMSGPPDVSTLLLFGF